MKTDRGSAPSETSRGRVTAVAVMLVEGATSSSCVRVRALGYDDRDAATTGGVGGGGATLLSSSCCP